MWKWVRILCWTLFFLHCAALFIFWSFSSNLRASKRLKQFTVKVPFTIASRLLSLEDLPKFRTAKKKPGFDFIVENDKWIRKEYPASGTNPFLLAVGHCSYLPRNLCNEKPTYNLTDPEDRFAISMPQSKSFLERLAIRKTYMRYPEVYHPKWNTSGKVFIFFLFGGFQDGGSVPWYIQEEAFIYKDMIFLSDLPQDGSSGKKFFFSKWVFKNYPNSTLVAKIDSETYVVVPKLLQALEAINSPGMLYWGNGITWDSDNYQCFEFPYEREEKAVPWVRGHLVVWGWKIRNLLVEANVPDELSKCTSHHSDVIFALTLHWSNITIHPEFNLIYENEMVGDLSMPIVSYECDQAFMENMIAGHPQHARINTPANLYAMWNIRSPVDGKVMYRDSPWMRHLFENLWLQCFDSRKWSDVEHAWATGDRSQMEPHWHCDSAVPGHSWCDPLPHYHKGGFYSWDITEKPPLKR
eukprot:Filipodium_phascolosomae@DN2247_c0_g1_i6.p1